MSRCTDQELIAKLQRLVVADRTLSVRLLVHLGEMDARRLFRELAYSSMFEYAVRALHMSVAEAYLRIHAARLGRQFPLVLELLGSGTLHLTGIKLLAPHLTPDNHVQLLERARGKSKREIELLVAEIAPKPDVASRMCRLPNSVRPDQTQLPGSKQTAAVTPLAATSVDSAAPGAAGTACSTVAAVASRAGATAAVAVPTGHALESTSGASAAGTSSDTLLPLAGVAHPQPASETSPTPAAAAHEPAFALQSPRERASCAPLSPSRYRLQLTVGQDTHRKLEQLQDLLRHRVPDGDLARIFELAVDAFLDKTMKQRFAHTSASKKSRVTPAAAREKSTATQPAAATKPPAARAVTPEASRVDSAAAPGEQRVHQAAVPDKLRARKLRSLSRYIPRAVVREVHARDGGQCTFVSAQGQRCAARGFLEIHHHDVPFARGGEPTAANLRLMCRVHNSLLAERDFGPGYMLRRLRENRSASALAPERGAQL